MVTTSARYEMARVQSIMLIPDNQPHAHANDASEAAVNASE